MRTIKFTEGMNFDTGGPYRVIRRSDGHYVVGQGLLCAVDSHEEGERLIARLTARADDDD